MSQRYLGGIITANPTTPTLTTESGVWTLEQQLQYSSVWSPNIIGNSLRFRSSANAYLNRTNASSPTNAIKWTWSGWVKRGSLGAQQNLVGATNSGSDDTYFQFNSSDQIVLGSYTGAGTDYGIRTSAVFRDPSAWYHIVAVLDTANATSADRAILYVNGVRQAVTNSANGMWPQNATNNKINTASQVVNIGRRSLGDSYLDGYLTEINFVDGQALTPFSFGAYDSTGVWQPLLYTGTYGTNGYYLTFADNSGTTSTTLGKDYSGNGNNWTPNNLSLTSGTTYDWMLDSPTNWSNGTGNGRGNYCTLNPLQPASTTVVVPTDGNLRMTGTVSGNNVTGTMAIQASTYFECTVITGGGTVQFGVRNLSTGNTYFYDSSGNKVLAGASTAYGASFTTNDLIGVAVDPVSLTLQFFKNGTSQGTITSAFPSGDYVPFFYASNTNSSAANFGQRPFTYTPPSGFVALNTNNLSNPAINNGAQYMAATTYTGTGATQSITNGGNNTIGTTFRPDWVWIKSRSAATNNELTDSVRGATKSFVSNSSAAETTDTNGLTAFGSTGFTVGTDTNYNNNTATYVAWQWQAGAGTTSSNTAGSITSTVSVNTTAGFSIVTYTGTGTNATVGHGLGVAPSMIFVKNRSQISANIVGHANMAASSPWNGFLQLNQTAAYTTASGNLIWNNTAPTSTVFSIGTDTSTNFSGNSLVAYCFAAVAGYSAFGSYTGNGSSDGPFVFCGFRPRWVMIKRTDSTSDWRIIDTSRDTYNVASAQLYPDLANAEASGAMLDALSNGFKIRNTDTGYNGSGGTFIYAAFAENPFKIARAR